MIAVLFGDFVVEAIDVGDVAGLMVASQQDDCFGIL